MKNTNRRDFIKKLGMAAVAVPLLPYVLGAEPSTQPEVFGSPTFGRPIGELIEETAQQNLVQLSKRIINESELLKLIFVIGCSGTKGMSHMRVTAPITPEMLHDLNLRHGNIDSATALENSLVNEAICAIEKDVMSKMWSLRPRVLPIRHANQYIFNAMDDAFLVVSRHGYNLLRLQHRGSFTEWPHRIDRVWKAGTLQMEESSNTIPVYIDPHTVAYPEHTVYGRSRQPDILCLIPDHSHPQSGGGGIVRSLGMCSESTFSTSAHMSLACTVARR